jgi:uncharacterized protein
MSAPPEGEALWIPRCRAIHTFGMRFSLDLVWLDGSGHVVRFDHNVKPGRICRCSEAQSVVERAAGLGDTEFSLN